MGMFSSDKDLTAMDYYRMARIEELEQIIRQSEIARKECESKIRTTTDDPLLIDLYMIVSGFIGDNVGRVEKALRELQALRETKP